MVDGSLPASGPGLRDVRREAWPVGEERVFVRHDTGLAVTVRKVTEDRAEIVDVQRVADWLIGDEA